MTRRNAMSRLAVTISLALAGAPLAAPGRASASGSSVAAPKVPVYVPPPRGAPTGRISGGSRGTDRDGPELRALAPDHVGLTVRAQPALYWFAARVPAAPTEITLTVGRAVQPILEARLTSPRREGVHVVRLADHGITLDLDVDYRWQIAIVRDADARSRDIVAGGTIRRVAPSAALEARVARTAPAELSFVYAEESLWYDALMALGELIDADPRNQLFRLQRGALLEQIGLRAVADHERQRAP